MGIGAYIPFWNQLTENQKGRLEAGPYSGKQRRERFCREAAPSAWGL